MLNHLLISLHYKEEQHFQNQYSEFTNTSQVKSLSGRAWLSRGGSRSFLPKLQVWLCLQQTPALHSTGVCYFAL